MSTPMYEVPEHFPIDLNADGEGPETNPELIVKTVCWSCRPDAEWPCEPFRVEVSATAEKYGIEL